MVDVILYAVALASPQLSQPLDLCEIRTRLNCFFLVKQQAANFEGLSACLFWFKGTSAQGLQLQSKVRRSGLMSALPCFFFLVMICLLRIEWGEKRGKSPMSP